MMNKKTAIINWINIALSFIALILECIPKSIKYACLIGPKEYGPIHYWSYFGNPLSVDGPFLLTLIVAILTILCLCLNIIILLKNKKSMSIALIVLSSLGLILNSILFSKRREMITAYNIAISIVFFILLILQVVNLRVILKTSLK